MRASPPSQRDAALAAARAGRPDALSLVRDALSSAPHDGALLTTEARLAAEADETKPFARMEDILARAPDWLDGHRALAELKTEFHLPDPFASFAAATKARPRDPALWLAYIQSVAKAGDCAKAADMARDLRQRIVDVPPLQLVEARYAGLAGDAERAETLLAGLPDDVPDRDIERLRNALRLSDIERAADLAEQIADHGERLRSFWALAELAWRMADRKERHHWLLDPEAMIAVRSLPLEPDRLADTIRVLDTLHGETHEPLGQSVRGGSQTHGDLRDRQESEIAHLFSAIEGELEAFSKLLPDLPEGHPLANLSQPRPQIVSSWSIRLRPGGSHVAHLHELGLISSACHLAQDDVPEGEGLLELGVPPADIPLELEPLASVAARPGQLALFPSFFYHRVTPISAGSRLSVAFDAL